jgi:hypothetical protein
MGGTPVRARRNAAGTPILSPAQTALRFPAAKDRPRPAWYESAMRRRQEAAKRPEVLRQTGQVRRPRRPARRGAAASRAARRVPKNGTPRSPSGTLTEVLKFQAKSTAALRAVKMPMAVEPSFIFKP